MKSINIKLNPEKDKDIIEFMKDRPKTWIIKTALREYMQREKESSKPSKPSKKLDESVLESLE